MLIGNSNYQVSYHAKGLLLHVVGPKPCLRNTSAKRWVTKGRQLTRFGCGHMNNTAVDGPRVLSIQSHVVHGYVGSKCAIFPLQLLGLDVDPIFSVQFSNHTGYPVVKGSVFDGQHLHDLLTGLEQNNLKSYSHLLTGFIGSASLLKMVAEVLKKLRSWNSEVHYVCDPVMGDDGRLYVKPDIVEAFKQEIVPLASILVPNQFEAELLTESTISSIEDGFKVCQKLHAQGPHTVIITSMSLPSDPDNILLLASTVQLQAQGSAHQQLVMKIPKIKAYFTGTGDLLAALLLGWLHHHPNDLALVVDKSVAGLQAVLLDTAAKCGEAALKAQRTAEVCNARELRLIQNQKKLAQPDIVLKCTPWLGLQQ